MGMDVTVEDTMISLEFGVGVVANAATYEQEVERTVEAAVAGALRPLVEELNPSLSSVLYAYDFSLDESNILDGGVERWSGQIGVDILFEAPVTDRRAVNEYLDLLVRALTTPDSVKDEGGMLAAVALSRA